MNQSNISYIDQIREKVRSAEIVPVLNEEMVWSRPGPLLWQADSFDGRPCFNPVYRWQNYYSYSLLALIVKKGNLNINQQAYKKANARNFLSLYSSELIDKDIVKVGGPIINNCSIDDTAEYLEKVAVAMTEDVALAEHNNPGCTNVILSGGTDSMNMLLLPWKNPVIALSADPNFPLICEFVKRNNLDIEVRRLEDIYDQTMLEEEILECCCTMELSNWKWGADLRAISDEFENKVIFWQGQYSEILLSTDWKSMVWPKSSFTNFFGKIYKRTSPFLPPFIRYPIGEWIAKQCAVRAWNFTSAKLGGHMAFIRALTSAFALSAYQGPNMTRLYGQVNQARAVQRDLRKDLGKLIAGEKVWYPDINPGPPLSQFRKRAQVPDKFIKLLKKNNISVIT